MSLKRDLSGFAAPVGLPAPPPPPAFAPAVVSPAGEDVTPVQGAEEAAPAAEPTPARATRAARGATASGGRAAAQKSGGGRPGRKRICVSLTLETSEQLAELAQARRAWKVEVILESLAHWDGALRDGGGEAEQARFRRRRSSTPTPFVMDLTPEELRRLDELARAVGSSRSALVRQLILLEAADAAAAADGLDR